MNAYSELYIEKAQITLANMIDYAVYDLCMDVSRFYDMFINSRISRSFGVGEPKYTVGMSGIELAQSILYDATGDYKDISPTWRDDRTPEYWAGWAVAYYEWCTAIPFDRINETVPITEIIEMYYPLHEADITKFVDAMNLRMQSSHEQSRLARFRAYAKLSQNTLAQRSGVSVRMIEQYEQGRKDISRASVSTIYRLSRVLGCRVEDLIPAGGDPPCKC